MKRFLCAVSALLALSVSALAADPAVPGRTPERYAGALTEAEPAASATAGKVTMPYNDGSGRTGLILFRFTAAGDTLRWTVDWNNAAGDAYHFRLWRLGGAGAEPVPVEPAREALFGVEQQYTGLIEGEEYFLRVSSMCTEKDVSATYTYRF